MNTRTKRIWLIAFVTTFGFSLGGCSSEPSSKDIEKAITDNFTQNFAGDQNPFLKNADQTLFPKINGIKKVACAKAEKNSGYNCDVEMDVTLPFVGQKKNVAQFRFIKGPDGWMVSQ